MLITSRGNDLFFLTKFWQPMLNKSILFVLNR